MIADQSHASARPRLARRHPSLQRLDSAFSAGILPLLRRRSSNDNKEDEYWCMTMASSNSDSGSSSNSSSIGSPTFSHSSRPSTATSRSNSGSDGGFLSSRKPNISSVSAATFAALLSGPLVTVTVGSNTTEPPRTWSLHRALLAYHSPFFAARFGSTSNERVKAYAQDANSNSKDSNETLDEHEGANTKAESDKQHTSSTTSTPSKPPKLPARGKPHTQTPTQPLELSLPDDSPSSFELLVRWLYQGNIDDEPSEPPTDPLEAKWQHALRCQNLHFLSQRLGLATLRDLSLDQFRRSCHEAGLVPGPEEMQPVYARTPIGSPFRRLVSSIAARQIMDPDTERNAETYRGCFEADAGFAVDVVNAIRKGMGGRLLDDPTEGWGGCEWHEHEEGEPCELKKGSGILKKRVTWNDSK